MPSDLSLISNIHPALKEFEFDEFLAFCESKDPAETFDSGNMSTCALGQYGIEVSLSTCESLGLPLQLYADIVHRGAPNFGRVVNSLKAYRSSNEKS